MNTQHTFMLKRLDKIFLLCLLTWRFDYPLLARTTPVSNIFIMVPKVFEPLKIYCRCKEAAVAQTGNSGPFCFLFGFAIQNRNCITIDVSAVFS